MMKAPRTLSTFKIDDFFFRDSSDLFRELRERISEHQWVSCGPKDALSVGFYGDSEIAFLDSVNASILHGTIRIEKKTPPRSLVQDLFKKEIRRRNSAGERVSREEQALIKNRVRDKLLPKTLPDYTHVGVYFVVSSPGNRTWMFIDKSSSELVEPSIDHLVQSGAISGRPTPLIGRAESERAFQSAEIGTKFLDDLVTANGHIRVFHRKKGLYETFFRDPKSIQMGSAEMIDSMHFESAELSFLLRYDGVIGQINWAFAFERSAEQCMAMCIQLVDALIPCERG